jgi:hypothetical protein
MEGYKKVFKVFLVGQEEKETEWLSKMSKEGYHLVNIKFATYYTFKKGEPKNYTYFIDLKETCNLDKDEYKLMYSDAGLDYIDNSNGYYYFKAESKVETDIIIKNEKGRYLGRLNSQKKVILMAGIMNIFIFGVNLFHHIGENASYYWAVYLNLAVGLVCLFAYFGAKSKIKQLKESGVIQPYKTKLKDWNSLYAVSVICIIIVIIYSIIVVIESFI